MVGTRLRGLGTAGNLTPDLVPTVTFGPTLGITAGRIDKLGVDIRSYRVPLLQAIRSVMVPSIRRNFTTGGRPKWDALSPDTAKIRSKLGYDGESPILVRTGTLARVASQINIWDITTTSAVIRDLPDKAWYGKVHQAGYEGHSMAALIKKHGGDIDAANQEQNDRINSALSGGESLAGQSRTSPTIPARPFLVIQDEDIDAMHEVFIAWLGSRINADWPV